MTTHPQSRAAVEAANHWTAWGAFAARRYCEKRGVHPRLLMLAHQLVSITWEVDGASGSTECQAWEGQYRIERLTAAGYTIISVKPHY